MPYLAHHKQTPNLLAALLLDNRRYLPIVEFLDTIVAGASELTWRECEQIGQELAEQTKSAFCVGIRSGMIAALGAEGATDRSERLQPVLAYARKLNDDSSMVSLADIQSIRDAGWNEQTIEDVAGLVAALKVYGLIANGLGFRAVPASEFAEAAAATVDMGGYVPVFRAFAEQNARGTPK